MGRRARTPGAPPAKAQRSYSQCRTRTCTKGHCGTLPKTITLEIGIVASVFDNASMSANPTRIDWEETTADAGSPLQEGNRVLESIARREAMRALLAFSDLHEQIRDRRAATGIASDRDLFETERFILDEVLQLICDRAQAITQADSIV